MFILTHPDNFPCGKKPEHPEKTHDFWQSFDRLFSHESVARIEPTISETEVRGACFDECATKGPWYVAESKKNSTNLCLHVFVVASRSLPYRIRPESHVREIY